MRHDIRFTYNLRRLSPVLLPPKPSNLSRSKVFLSYHVASNPFFNVYMWFTGSSREHRFFANQHSRCPSNRGTCNTIGSAKHPEVHESVHSPRITTISHTHIYRQGLFKGPGVLAREGPSGLRNSDQLTFPVVPRKPKWLGDDYREVHWAASAVRRDKR